MVRVCPALTVKASPTAAWCEEFKVFAMPSWLPFSSSSVIPAMAVSAARPVRSTVMLDTVTSPSLPAVSLTTVKGTRTAFSGAREAAGWVPAETLKPVPGTVTTGGVVPGGVVTPPPATSALYLALEMEPK